MTMETWKFQPVLPEVAIYRQTGDFREQAGDKIFEKIACDFSSKFGDFQQFWSKNAKLSKNLKQNVQKVTFRR